MRDKGDYIEKQAMIFDTIKNYIKDNKISPTIRELCKILKINSTSTMWEHIKQLKTDGYISMTDSSPRSIRIERNFYKIVKSDGLRMEVTEDEIHNKWEISNKSDELVKIVFEEIIFEIEKKIKNNV